MIALPQREARLLVALHGWSAVALGLLLYTVLATGTVAVMADEIGHWSTGALDARAPLTRPVDAILRRAVADAPPALREVVDLAASGRDGLRVSLRDAPGPEQRGIDVETGPDGRVLHRREGLAADIAGRDPDGALAAFLVGIHVRLYIPGLFGYVVTGVAGLALLLAALSGLAIHRHLLRDLFTLRVLASPPLSARDRHNLAGTWALPFALVLAVTGAFFSFAAPVGFPTLAWVSFGGDQQALFTALLGPPPDADPSPAAIADLDAVAADAGARAGAAPTFIRVAHPGRADARVTVYAETRPGDIAAATLVYDGVTGAFLERRPAVGRAPSLGGTLYGLMAPLHFGHFAGLASKLAWTAMGFCCCSVTVGGLRLWLVRRATARPGWAALDRATSVVALGLPLAMAGSGVGYFLGLADGATVESTAVGFLAAGALALVAGVALRRPALDGVLRVATGLALAALPPLRLAAGGPDWATALAAGCPAIAFGDAALLGLALALLHRPGRALLRARHDAALAGPRRP